MPRPAAFATAYDPAEPDQRWLNLPVLRVAVLAAVRQRAELAAQADQADRTRGFTLSDVSRECGVGLPKLSGLLHGERPSARTLGLVLAWLGLDPSPFMVAGPESEPVDVTAELLAS